MARGARNKLPKKVSFFHKTDGYDKGYYGPYMKKPTGWFKDMAGEFIEFELDKEGNYIRKK